jgi:uncharacterized membrane protein
MSVGKTIAPPRFIAFAVIVLLAVPIGVALGGWRLGLLGAFDAGALVFLLSTIPLLRESDADKMRERAKTNDANRTGLLVIAAAVMIAVVVAVALELTGSAAPSAARVALIIATLAIAWSFANMVYALHYAHLFYQTDEHGRDRGGIDVPGTDEPEYWDFVYFAFTLGMTFQTSDVEMRTTRFRKVATFHSLAAFVFNLGVVAFTVNVLGS